MIEQLLIDLTMTKKNHSQMLKLIILVMPLTLVSASLDPQWEVFKSTHNKIYNSGKEEAYRRFVWQTNLKKIKEHNIRYQQGKSSFYMAENPYTDMTSEEFNDIINSFSMKKPGLISSDPPACHRHRSEESLPDFVDWRLNGYVTCVKNQGPCGSGWAFSTTGSLEGQHFNATGKLVSLSESNLVDCSDNWGTHGCKGGNMDNAFDYIIDNGGIDIETGYPYAPQERPCNFTKSDIGATMRSYVQVVPNEDALQHAVSLVGPISAAIDASHASYQYYGGGVYDEPNCSSTDVNHGVLVIGYGSIDGQEYWLVKNSLGIKWGQDGFIMMSRNKNNQCGIATSASYPVV